MKMNVKLSLLSVMSVALIACSEHEQNAQSEKGRGIISLKEEYIANYKINGQGYAWKHLREQTEKYFPYYRDSYLAGWVTASAHEKMHQEYLEQKEKKRVLIAKKAAEIAGQKREDFEKCLAERKQKNQQK